MPKIGLAENLLYTAKAAGSGKTLLGKSPRPMRIFGFKMACHVTSGRNYLQYIRNYGSSSPGGKMAAVLIKYRLYHEGEVSTGFINRGPQARGL